MAPSHMGGLETVVAELLSAAQPSAVVLTCYALLAESEPLPAPFELLVAQGIHIVRIPARHRAYREHYKLLRNALREAAPQLIHSHGYHADVLSALLARSLGVPHVSTLHGFVGSTRRGRLYERLQLAALRRAAAVIAVSETVAVKARAHNVQASHVHLIPNAAPGGQPLGREAARDVLGIASLEIQAALKLSRAASAPDQPTPLGDVPVIGWIGRLSDEKNPLGFVSLVQALRDSELPVVGVVVGDGPLMSQVRAAGQELVSSGHLRIAGSMPDAGRLVRAFNALLLTSSTEGTPMVALEAMRAGVPVVSTAVGGVPAMLEPDCGVLVPYGNVLAMQQAVTALLQQPAHAAQLAEHAQVRVKERYSQDAWWSAHVALYNSIAKRQQ